MTCPNPLCQRFAPHRQCCLTPIAELEAERRLVEICIAVCDDRVWIVPAPIRECVRKVKEARGQ